jgi:hypothetical protein
MSKKLSEIIFSSDYRWSSSLFVSEIGLDPELYEVFKTPQEVLEAGGAADAIICTKKTDNSWMCKNCKIYHTLGEPRVDYVYHYKTYGMVDSICRKSTEAIKIIGDCVICNGPINDDFAFCFDLINQNATVIVLHCSERCKDATYQHHKLDPTRGTRCGFCGDIEKKKKRCGGCKKVYYCSRECQSADWKVHKANCTYIGK